MKEAKELRIEEQCIKIDKKMNARRGKKSFSTLKSLTKTKSSVFLSDASRIPLPKAPQT
ncbi:hypothetical protein DPMN_038323 [Dreissena polymorpha]|uniref:Uncharacterized protein n=1 Tax=Dreissena polymorpha TaxID=45954 RepID=A0A9D4MCI8_DREPO|nr:hypothetical protein DPMN_038323 [Dreissena polymorpha]